MVVYDWKMVHLDDLRKHNEDGWDYVTGPMPDPNPRVWMCLVRRVVDHGGVNGRPGDVVLS